MRGTGSCEAHLAPVRAAAFYTPYHHKEDSARWPGVQGGRAPPEIADKPLLYKYST